MHKENFQTSPQQMTTLEKQLRSLFNGQKIEIEKSEKPPIEQNEKQLTPLEKQIVLVLNFLRQLFS
jgi:hypothetical protein